MKNKIKYIIPSIITLLPILYGVIVWNKLPEKMLIHFDINGSPDSFANKPFAVFFMPLILFLIYWICLFFELKFGKNSNNSKLMAVVIYTIPAISVIVSTIIYALALGKEINIGVIFSFFFGILFIMIGNYLPKCKQNKTLGIKLPWTFKSEENWNATHRFAGKLWVICGFAWLILGLILPNFAMHISLVITFLAVIIPTVYSYLYHKKTK